MSQQVQDKTRLPYIGLAKIWGESSGLTAVAFSAKAHNIVKRVKENIFKAPLTSSLTLLTITLSLSLVALFIIAIRNIDLFIQQNRVDVGIHLFLRDNLEQSVIDNLKSELEKNPLVTRVDFRTKDIAWQKFKDSLGADSRVLDGLEEDNPLPASFDILVRDDASEEQVDLLVQRYRENSVVEQVRYSQGLIRQLGRISSSLTLVGWFGILLLIVLTGSIISNTIKLALYSHRAEIEIMQLVGASRWSIRAPYLLEGMLQGVAGGLFGIFLTFSAFIFLRNFLVEAGIFQGFIESVTFLTFRQYLLLILLGIGVGVSASLLAVQSFLKAET